MKSSLRGGIDSNKYACIHQWVIYHYGKADRCENKKCAGKSKNYEWALKRGGIYDYKRSRFIRLCVSCHRKYDLTEEFVKKMSKLNPRKKWTYCKQGHLLSRENTKYTRHKRSLDGKPILRRECRTCANLRLKKYYRTKHPLALTDLQVNKERE